MTTTARDAIAEMLGEARPAGSFVAERTAPADDLRIDVKGVGLLRFPLTRVQARRLCGIARPARYGQGEKTLLDKRVRDNWEVPKGRVRIDGRRWTRMLLPMLEALRDDLGLPEGARLKAELQSVLVYAPGQFFKRHQDSEKSDEMVGSLVVTLPCRFEGGALVVEHVGEQRSFNATRQRLSFVAFYADCRHEVRPVTSGYRVVLTYNLSLEAGAAAAAARAAAAEAMVDPLAARLRTHFETPAPARSWEADRPPRLPPSRLVYLLDHQYTERALAWGRLKGRDAARADVLRAAAERAGCDVALALAEVHETWSVDEEEEPWFRQRRRWADGETWEDEPEEEDHEERGLEEMELVELQVSELTLRHWIAPDGERLEGSSTGAGDDEVCATTPSCDLTPYASEHEGYMGNWGNTMDRWYRRGALIVWPRELVFKVRGEASPAWALQVLHERIRGGGLADARKMAASLAPSWARIVKGDEPPAFFEKVLLVAESLDAAPLAAALLRPCAVEALTPAHARAFTALVARYGEAWTRSLLAAWSGELWRPGPPGKNRETWPAALPRLCKAMLSAGGAAGALAARMLLEHQWARLKAEHAAWAAQRPSDRDALRGRRARTILGWLEAAATAGTDDLREAALSHLCESKDSATLTCLVQVVRLGSTRLWCAPALDAIASRCATELTARLEQPPRAADDWSVALPARCACALCARLRAFLADPRQRRLEWPLATQKRRHVHSIIDGHEMPVRHLTRRTGSPYTLILDKTEALHQRAAAERRGWQRDLDWLVARR